MSAVISPCGKYRYRLEREVQKEGKVFAFFGINPSTADATQDDATLRKWKGFALRNGCSRFIVGNVFAYRATDVKELRLANDAVGIYNSTHLKQIIHEADVLVPCWGNTNKVPRCLRLQIASLKLQLLNAGKPLRIFGLTKDGDPLHPLMLGYDTQLVPWI